MRVLLLAVFLLVAGCGSSPSTRCYVLYSTTDTPTRSGTVKYLYVDIDKSPGNTGDSWANAFHHVQEALSAASGLSVPVEIWVKEGTYTADFDPSTLTNTGSRYATFQLEDWVSLFGGFNGTETAREERDPNSNITILSGEIAGPNCYHVVTAIDCNLTRLDGFTIQGGLANGNNFPDKNGGGLLVVYETRDTSPTIANCVFTNNEARGGAGAFCRDAAADFLNCTFKDNRAWGPSGGFGGGLLVLCGRTDVVNSEFFDNFASQFGGAVYISDHSSTGYTTLTNCTIVANEADSGGAISVSSGTPIVRNCVIWSNVNTVSGGTSITGGSPDVDFCCVEGGWSGGAAIISSDPLLADVGSRDFSLLDGSPCLDFGLNDELPSDRADLDEDGITLETISLDLAGNRRIDHCTVDLGAFERLQLDKRPPDDVRVVRADASTGGDGLTWETAYTLEEALDALLLDSSIAISELWLAEGTYVPDPGGSDRTKSFKIVPNRTYYGGFAACESTLDQRDPETHKTILSGDLNGDDTSGFGSRSDNSYHVIRWVYSVGSSQSTTLDGLTVRGGQADGTGDDEDGAGLHLAYSIGTLNLNDCTIEDNFSSGLGAGIFWDSDPDERLSLTDVAISANKSDATGAGLYVLEDSTTVGAGGHLSIDRATFTVNAAARGGGIGLNSGDLESIAISNSLFYMNDAIADGGAIYSQNDTSPSISNCTFVSNAPTSSGYYNVSAHPRFTNCIFWDCEIFDSNPFAPSTLDYSCYEGGWPGHGTGHIDPFDPLFVSLPSGDLRLVTGSPCIDSGDNSVLSAGWTDLDGNDRIVDGDSDGTATVDMGAYETQ